MLAYGVYLLLTHAPIVGVVLLLSMCWCCSCILCPRGNITPLKPKDSVLTCYGLCDPSEVRFYIPTVTARAPKPEKPITASSSSSSVRAELVGTGSSARVPRRGNDHDPQEEKAGFLV